MINSNSIIKAEENGVQYFTIAATGESGMSQRGLARACGKSQQALSKLIKALTTNSAPKRLHRFLGKDLALTTNYSSSDISLRNATIYRSDFCFAVIKHYALEGSEIAEATLDAVGEIGLTSYIQSKTQWLPSEYQSSFQSRQQLDRILDKPCPYEALYSKETCTKGFTWFGSSFYWRYFYNWMNHEERAKHEELNPLVNGQRKHRIHQWIEPDTKNRLRDKAIELGVLIRQSSNRDQFQNNFQAMYGSGYQLDLFN
jgi:hypothetical protein